MNKNKFKKHFYLQAPDNGLYECQVSTTPVMSHYVYLKVAGNTIFDLD